MDFNASLQQKLERYKAFYNDPKPGQLLITIPPYTFEAPPRNGGGAYKTLKDWHPFEDAEAMAESSVAFERYFAEYTADVGSDYIPNICPSYGIGLCSAFLSNAEVIPGIDTTWIHPVMEDIFDESHLQFDPNNPWIDFMCRYMKRARELWDGDFCIGAYSAMAPSDLANALRGNDLFYDLYDEPEGVHRLLDICVDATAKAYDVLRPYTLAMDGGYIAGGMWMPGEGMFLSEDGADLCSPDTYREFYMPATQKLVDRIGGAYIHHHAKGWAIHSLISQVENVDFLEFSWDPKCPRPVDHLDQLLEGSLHTPLQIRCTLDDLRRYLPQMKQGRVSVMVNVDTKEEAKEAVRLVRNASVI